MSTLILDLSLVACILTMRYTRGVFRRSPSAEKHMRIALAPEPREGSNTQDQAGRLMAETGHHFEDMVLPVIHMMSQAVFMTVRDDDTLGHFQFFNPVTFESQRLTEDTRCHG